MTLANHAARHETAIKRAGREHGTPNWFSFKELHTYYGAPAPMIAGRAIHLVQIPGMLLSPRGGVELEVGAILD